MIQAKPIIDCGNARDIIDPKLDKNFDEDQIQRMILAAKFCITRSARLRPKMMEVLQFGQTHVSWLQYQIDDIFPFFSPGLEAPKRG